MQGIDTIKNRILEEARLGAADRIKAAREEARAALEGEQNRIRAQEIEAEKAVCAEARVLYERTLTVAGLEERKVLLKAKQEVIGRVFDRLTDMLCGMKDADYRDFMAARVIESAEDGDRVMVSLADEKRLDEAWLKKLNRESGLKLTFAEARHEAGGGVILAGTVCDKNLTLRTIVEQLRPLLETEIAEELFGR